MSESDDQRRPLPAIALPPAELERECEFTFTRRGGPGGQHRNKVSSAVVITHRPTGITAEASERRSQAENRSVALGRLRVELALRQREDVSSVAQPLVAQYGSGPLRVSTGNEDYAVVLADILNRINDDGGSLAEAAEFWQTTSSQIVRLLSSEPRALAMVNSVRAKNGLRTLKR